MLKLNKLFTPEDPYKLPCHDTPGDYRFSVFIFLVQTSYIQQASLQTFV
jgi:hypothetical protein